MPSGLKAITEDFKKNAPTSFAPTIRQLKVFKNEHAFVRFLATGDDKDHRFQSYAAHEMSDGNKFWDEYCTSDDTGLCDKCLTKKPKPRFGVWLWVDTVLRKFQNPAFTEGREGAVPWKKTIFGIDEEGQPEAFYVQEINDVRLFTKGPGRQGYIINQLLSAYNNFSTLMDRPYIITRKGERMETNYSISPHGDKSPISEKQSSIYNQLPAIIDVLSGKAFWPPKRDADVKVEDGEVIEEFKPFAGEKISLDNGPVIMESSDVIVMKASDAEKFDEEVELDNPDEPEEVDQDSIQKSLDDALNSIAGIKEEPVVRKKAR